MMPKSNHHSDDIFWFRETTRKKLPGLCIAAAAFLYLASNSWAADKATEKKNEKKDAKAESSAPAAEPATDISLETDVYYKWQPVMADGNPSAEPLSVFYSKVSATGKTEAEAKSQLKSLLPEVQSAAENQCRLEHQSKATCIKSRYSKLSTDFSKLDFAIRHQVIANIEADCNNVHGKCLGVAVTEAVSAPKLTVVKSPVGGSEPALSAIAPEASAPPAPAKPAPAPEPAGTKPQEPDTPLPFGFQ